MMPAGQIEAVAKGTLQESVECFQESDDLAVEELLRTVCLSYVSHQASRNRRDVTGVQLTFHPQKRVMWIRSLHVASAFRFHGLGQQLVSAAERLAHKIGICRINLMPLTPARPFWEKMGYAPHPKMTRVLTKSLGSGK